MIELNDNTGDGLLHCSAVSIFLFRTVAVSGGMAAGVISLDPADTRTLNGINK